MSKDLGQRLIILARARIAADLGVSGPAMPEVPDDGVRRGVFVTLKTGDRLRGCIGRIESNESLARTTSAMAAAAAFSDPRFPSLSSEEFAKVTLEVSVLSPPYEINPEAVEVGRHGLIIERGARRGLLLPQVATEWNWDRDTFLRQTCVKAGLPESAYLQPDTRVLAFEVEIFSEED